jgi:AAA family ATP:ADP antiporter
MTQASIGSKIRNFMWPIYGKEHYKFLPMSIMIGLIIFNYTVLRTIKDSLVVTNAGTETITFLKVWAVVPAAFLFFFLYTKISNVLSKPALFYTLVVPFLAFFALFAFVLYPNKDVLHPHASADYLQSVLPAGFHGIIAMYRYWTFSLFYTLAELWGSVVLSLSFWQLANDVTTVKEAKRFYAHFYLLGNLFVFAAGYVTRHFSLVRDHLAPGIDPWAYTLNYLISIVTVAGLIVVGLYYFLQHHIFNRTDVELPPVHDAPKGKKKPKMSMGESIRFLISSRYLALIAVLVLAYNMCINLTEVAWKHRVHLQYPTENGYNGYMGFVYMCMGVATFVVILIGSAIVRNLGWKKGALATPIMLGITGLAFFGLSIFDSSLEPIIAMLGTTPLMLAVMFGTIQNVLSKSTKYALFDPTKEMAYIPLDSESKMKGKAAIDVVGSRLGKSGGALLQQAMFLLIGPITVIMPYSAVLMLIIIVAWVVAVYALNTRFTALTEADEKAEAAKHTTTAAA